MVRHFFRANFRLLSHFCGSQYVSSTTGYYAAFCQARNHLRDTTSYIPSRTKDTHWEVITHFRDNRNSERRKIGQDLGRLFEYRKQADYEDDYRGSLPINTQTALTLTGRILTRLARLE